MLWKDTGEKIVAIRRAYGSVRQVLPEGKAYYRDAREEHVILENAADEHAWKECGPQPEFNYIDLREPGLRYVYEDNGHKVGR